MSARTTAHRIVKNNFDRNECFCLLIVIDLRNSRLEEKTVVDTKHVLVVRECGMSTKQLPSGVSTYLPKQSLALLVSENNRSLESPHIIPLSRTVSSRRNKRAAGELSFQWQRDVHEYETSTTTSRRNKKLGGPTKRNDPVRKATAPPVCGKKHPFGEKLARTRTSRPPVS